MAIPLCRARGAKPGTLECTGGGRPGCRHQPDLRTRDATACRKAGLSQRGFRRTAAMTLIATDSIRSVPDPITYLASQASVSSRDVAIDTMRGIAILMVIGIHSLQQPLSSWQTLADAPLRPCVPIFLFASGYLTARSGRVPLWKRLKAALVPYAIAF